MIARIKENIDKGKDFGWAKAEDVAAVMAHIPSNGKRPERNPSKYS